MFTNLEQRSWVKFEVEQSRSTQCFQGLREACGDVAFPYLTVTRWVKAFRGRQGCRTGRPHVENNTIQFLVWMLIADELRVS